MEVDEIGEEVGSMFDRLGPLEDEVVEVSSHGTTKTFSRFVVITGVFDTESDGDSI